MKNGKVMLLAGVGVIAMIIMIAVVFGGLGSSEGTKTANEHKKKSKKQVEYKFQDSNGKVNNYQKLLNYLDSKGWNLEDSRGRVETNYDSDPLGDFKPKEVYIGSKNASWGTFYRFGNEEDAKKSIEYSKKTLYTGFTNKQVVENEMIYEKNNNSFSALYRIGNLVISLSLAKKEVNKEMAILEKGGYWGFGDFYKDTNYDNEQKVFKNNIEKIEKCFEPEEYNYTIEGDDDYKGYSVTYRNDTNFVISVKTYVDKQVANEEYKKGADRLASTGEKVNKYSWKETINDADTEFDDMFICVAYKDNTTIYLQCGKNNEIIARKILNNFYNMVG